MVANSRKLLVVWKFEISVLNANEYNFKTAIPPFTV